MIAYKIISAEDWAAFQAIGAETHFRARQGALLPRRYRFDLGAPAHHEHGQPRAAARHDTAQLSHHDPMAE